MKYSPTTYARALFEVMKAKEYEGQDKISRNLWLTLAKNGDQSRAESVLEALEELVVEDSGGRTIVLETAREIDGGVIKKLRSIFAPADKVRERVEPALVAGVRIIIDDERELDFSLAKKFRKIFNKK